MQDKTNDTAGAQTKAELRKQRKLANQLRRREQLRRVPLEYRLTCSVEDVHLTTGWGYDKIYGLINDGRLESTVVDRSRNIFVKSLLRLLNIDPPDTPAPRKPKQPGRAPD